LMSATLVMRASRLASSCFSSFCRNIIKYIITVISGHYRKKHSHE
jgi:hypothetical protein